MFPNYNGMQLEISKNKIKLEIKNYPEIKQHTPK